VERGPGEAAKDSVQKSSGLAFSRAIVSSIFTEVRKLIDWFVAVLAWRSIVICMAIFLLLLIFLLREMLVVVLVVVIFNHMAVMLLWLSGHIPPMQFPSSETNDRCNHRQDGDKKTDINHNKI
jgi:hypothetical protein